MNMLKSYTVSNFSLSFSSAPQAQCLPLWGGAPRSESKILMIAGGNHTLIHRWQKSLIFDGRGAPKAHIYKKPLPALRATLPKGEGFGTINPNLALFDSLEKIHPWGWIFFHSVSQP